MTQTLIMPKTKAKSDLSQPNSSSPTCCFPLSARPSSFSLPFWRLEASRLIHLTFRSQRKILLLSTRRHIQTEERGRTPRGAPDPRVSWLIGLGAPIRAGMRIRELRDGVGGLEESEDDEREEAATGGEVVAVVRLRAKRALVGAGARVLFYPTLLYNVLRNRFETEFRWWDRVDQVIAFISLFSELGQCFLFWT